MIVAVIDDLIFRSRIQAAAESAGASLTVLPSTAAADALRQAGGSLAIVDLAAPAALDRIRDLRARPGAPVTIIAFVSHVRGDLVADARAAGADRVLARSAFVAELPDLMRRAAAAS